ncbi:MAG: LuxR C-terminal-related transcriptional regulator [Gordonibacter sp.]|uniref:helix-turn-helix transcriptional regulator n=1 Tax=Gordonibacter sp. TaxID=1968902 RepID=UPI002FCABEDB
MQVAGSSTAKIQEGTSPALLSTYVLAGIGFGCMIAWDLIGIFSPALSLLSYESASQSIILRAVSVAAIAIAYAVCKLQADWVFEHRTRLAVVATVLSLTVVLNAVLHQFVDAPDTFALLAWVLFGIGDGVLCIVWCAYLSFIPTRRTGVAVAGGAAMGTVLFVMAATASPIGVSLGVIAFLPLASLAMLVFLMRQIPSEKTEAAKTYQKIPALSVRASLSVGAHGTVYGFISACMYLISPEAAIIVGASGIASCLGAAILSYRAPKTDWDNSVVQRLSLPVIVIGLLLMPLLDTTGQIVCGCLVNNALAFTAVMTWSTVSVENAEFHLHPVARYAARQAPLWVGFLAGTIVAFVLGVVLSFDQRAESLATALLAGIVVVAFSIYGANDTATKAQLEGLLAEDSPQPHEPESAPPALPQAHFHQRCDRVCDRHDLSPREAEIFFLLAKGRNAKFIQEELCISSSTVKTHIYRIYRKMNINSQQLLIDAVDAETKR